MVITNSCNFFEIDTNRVLFWGLNIKPKVLLISKEILDLADYLDLPTNEVIEIFDDNSLRFFKEVCLGQFKK